MHSFAKKHIVAIFRSNVVVEWLKLLLRFREVPGSHLGPEMGYPDMFFMVFLSSYRQIPV
jgi:hypothetical protein